VSALKNVIGNVNPDVYAENNGFDHVKAENESNEGS
jgi:hypothetical protein